jgi:hypothetical protein
MMLSFKKKRHLNMHANNIPKSIEHLHVALQYDPHATILLLQPTQAT